MVLFTELAALGFHQNDSGACEVGFVECLAFNNRRLRRRRITGDLSLRIGRRVLLNGWHEYVRHDGGQHPKDDNRNRQRPKQFRGARAFHLFDIDRLRVRLGGGHAAVTVHATAAPSWVTECSSRTWPSTLIRQPTESPSTCATRLNVAEAAIVVSE